LWNVLPGAAVRAGQRVSGTTLDLSPSVGRFQEEAADLRNRDLGSLDDKQLLAHLDAFEGRVAGET
jgi:hypothetical protein